MGRPQVGKTFIRGFDSRRRLRLTVLASVSDLQISQTVFKAERKSLTLASTVPNGFFRFTS